MKYADAVKVLGKCRLRKSNLPGGCVNSQHYPVVEVEINDRLITFGKASRNVTSRSVDVSVDVSVAGVYNQIIQQGGEV
jgi:hypothetical protein